MNARHKNWTAAAIVVLACGAVLRCGGSTTAPSQAALYIVGGPTPNFLTISAAIKAAPPGVVVEVHGGPIAERVVVDKPGIKLRGVSAILDGSTVDGGRGIGIHVNGAPDVEISGFTVRNFERGIVVQNATGAVILRNEVHSNNSKTANTAPPLAAGVDLFEGIVLLGASGAQVTENVLRNNGHDGLMIAGGSRNNVIRNNRILNNGAQTVPGQFGWGINLFSGPENTNNQITDNEITGNHWGILVGNFPGNSGNVIRNNRLRDNGRAGIAAVGVASGNTIEGNDATGNGLLNLSPSSLFDLFDAPPLDNTWRNNQGRFNFAGSASAAAAPPQSVVAEAFSAGGCLARQP